MSSDSSKKCSRSSSARTRAVTASEFDDLGSAVANRESCSNTSWFPESSGGRLITCRYLSKSNRHCQRDLPFDVVHTICRQDPRKWGRFIPCWSFLKKSRHSGNWPAKTHSPPALHRKSPPGSCLDGIAGWNHRERLRLSIDRGVMFPLIESGRTRRVGVLHSSIS